MKNILLACMILFPIAGCATQPNHGAVTVNGTTYDDDNWNGR